MKKFGVKITDYLNIWYNYYLSDDFIKGERGWGEFKEWYPLGYHSRKFDKPAVKWKDGSYFWWLDDKTHRVGKPAVIWGNGVIEYFENGMEIR